MVQQGTFFFSFLILTPEGTEIAKNNIYIYILTNILNCVGDSLFPHTQNTVDYNSNSQCFFIYLSFFRFFFQNFFFNFFYFFFHLFFFQNYFCWFYLLNINLVKIFAL
jgi:hypothetical protein